MGQRIIHRHRSRVRGFVVIECMKNITSLASTPVIVFGARDPKTNEKRALDAGAEAFLQEPVDNDGPIRTIQRSLIK